MPQQVDNAAPPREMRKAVEPRREQAPVIAPVTAEKPSRVLEKLREDMLETDVAPRMSPLESLPLATVPPEVLHLEAVPLEVEPVEWANDETLQPGAAAGWEPPFAMGTRDLAQVTELHDALLEAFSAYQARGVVERPGLDRAWLAFDQALQSAHRASYRRGLTVKPMPSYGGFGEYVRVKEQLDAQWESLSHALRKTPARMQTVEDVASAIEGLGFRRQTEPRRFKQQFVNDQGVTVSFQRVNVAGSPGFDLRLGIDGKELPPGIESGGLFISMPQSADNPKGYRIVVYRLEADLVAAQAEKVVRQGLKGELDRREQAGSDLASQARAVAGTRDELRAQRDQGRSPESRDLQASQDAAIGQKAAQVSARLDELKAQGKAPLRILTYEDGNDGGGKGSISEPGKQELERAGFSRRTISWKAPQRLERFGLQGNPLPEKDMELVDWDRGPAGDWAYSADATPEEVRRAGRDFKGMMGELRAKGILVNPVIVLADNTARARTFGKRLGESYLAQRSIREIDRRIRELRAAGQLTPALEGELKQKQDGLRAQVLTRVNPKDLRALKNDAPIEQRFLWFADAAGIPVVDGADRDRARARWLDGLLDALNGFGR